MDKLLRTWFGDDIELTSLSDTVFVMFVPRNGWLSVRTLQHVAQQNHLVYSITLNSSGRSTVQFSHESIFASQELKQTKLELNFNLPLSLFLQKHLDGVSNLTIGPSKTIGTTTIISVTSPTSNPISNTLFSQVLLHPKILDLHLKHRNLTVVSAADLHKSASLPKILRSGRLRIQSNEARKKRDHRLQVALKKVARRALVSNLQRN